MVSQQITVGLSGDLGIYCKISQLALDDGRPSNSLRALETGQGRVEVGPSGSRGRRGRGGTLVGLWRRCQTDGGR